MINLDHKAFFWEEFDGDNNPINPKECQIIFTPNFGARLLFLNDIHSDFNYEEKKDEVIEVLYGQAKNGKIFTLKNIKFEKAAFELTANLELTELEYTIEYIYYGGWLNIKDHIPIISVRYSYLELWLRQLEIKQPVNHNDKTMAGILVHKKNISCSTKDNPLLFGIDNSFNQNSSNNKTVTYEATNSLSIARKNNFDLIEAVEICINLKGFFDSLAFYAQNKIYIEELCFAHEVARKGFTSTEFVDILFKQDGYNEEKEMSRLDFLFLYNDIENDFVEVLNNWIENHSKNENEYSAFCNVIADKNTNFNVYSHFFQLISALEGYHRKNHPVDKDFIQKQKMYEKRLTYKRQSNLYKKKIEDTLNKLQNKNNPSFRIRLKELIDLSDIKSIVKLSNKIHKSISSLIYDTRNDIAHSNKNIIPTDKIKYAYEYLKLVSLLIMIKDISLNHNNFSKHIFDMEFKYLQENLEKAFGRNR